MGFVCGRQEGVRIRSQGELGREGRGPGWPKELFAEQGGGAEITNYSEAGRTLGADEHDMGSRRVREGQPVCDLASGECGYSQPAGVKPVRRHEDDKQVGMSENSKGN